MALSVPWINVMTMSSGVHSFLEGFHDLVWPNHACEEWVKTEEHFPFSEFWKQVALTSSDMCPIGWVRFKLNYDLNW